MSIEVNIKLRLATVQDFNIQRPGEDPRRKLGKDFFVRNSEGKIESYRITDQSNAERIRAWIEHKMIFVVDEDAEMEIVNN